MTPRLGDRSAFGMLQTDVYLEHAAVSPLSEPVRWAVDAALRDHARLGVAFVGPSMERREALRGAMARFLGAQPDDIGFPPGTTRGLVDLALAVPWAAGDRVVVFEGEFPSNVMAWERAATRFGGEVVNLPLEGFADGSGDGLQQVQGVLAAGGVRVIAVSAVQFSTGLRMPLKALSDLAHTHGAWLFVDGIQAVGGLPIDVVELGIDALVAGTHKWLMGLDGLAVAYAAPVVRAALRPLTAGWLSVDEPLSFLFEGSGHLRYDRPLRTSLDWMEGGVQNTAAFAALQASLGLLDALGPAAIAAHVQRWHDGVEPGLLERGFTSARSVDPAARSNILSVRPPGDRPLAWWQAELGKRGVAVSTPDGWLRMAPHWPNALGEPARVLEVLDDLGG